MEGNPTFQESEPNLYLLRGRFMLAIMGHMSRAMLERYSHIRLKAKREAVKSLELPKVGPRLVSSTPMSSRRQSQDVSDSQKAAID